MPLKKQMSLYLLLIEVTDEFNVVKTVVAKNVKKVNPITDNLLLLIDLKVFLKRSNIVD